jgi:hypothetical protein
VAAYGFDLHGSTSVNRVSRRAILIGVMKETFGHGPIQAVGGLCD